MVKPMMLPAVFAALFAFGAVPAFAQEGATDGAGKAPRARPAMISLDFGAGREVRVHCGTATIEACVAAITPLAEKVAATPAVPAKGEGKKGDRMHGKGEPGPDRKGHGKPDPDHDRSHGKEQAPGADAPPPVPE